MRVSLKCKTVHISELESIEIPDNAQVLTLFRTEVFGQYTLWYYTEVFEPLLPPVRARRKNV